MAVSILETLQNAKHNLCDAAIPMQKVIGKDQLTNAITLLEKGYSPETLVEPLVDKYGEVENVPDAE